MKNIYKTQQISYILVQIVILSLAIKNTYSVAIPNTCAKYATSSSGGYNNGNFYRAYVNNVNKGISVSRGWNFAVFDKNTGNLKKQGRFDTYGNCATNQSMINFINSISTGDWVAYGTLDSAESCMNSSSYAALRTIGYSSSLSIGHRCSFAAIGYKGMSANEATQQYKGDKQGSVTVHRCILNCGYRCSTCLDTALNCTSCKANATRLTTTQPDCFCGKGYYDNGSTLQCETCSTSCSVDCIGTGAGNCCSHKCDTCQKQTTSCTACSHTTRQNTPTCDCKATYFEISNQKECGKCIHPCGNCTVNSTNCQTCLLSRSNQKAPPSCECQEGYFEDPTTKNCLACHNKCKSCSSFDQCIQCKENSFRVKAPGCLCIEGYFNQGVNVGICGKCDYNCKSCVNSSENCLDCFENSFRENKPSCSCIQSYYNIPNQGVCLACSLSCDVNCIGPGDQNCCSNKCDACKTSTTQCTACSHSSREFVPTCNCKPTFFEISNQKECGKCIHPCGNCTINSTNCETCLSSRSNQKAPPSCECLEGYYEDPSTKNCLACHNKCKSCSSFDQCIECKENSFRQNGPDCLCIEGYFNQGVNIGQCGKCDYNCKSCVNSSDNCLECFQDSFRENKPSCTCEQGYFNVPNQGVCSKCSHACVSCNSANTNCETCSDTITRGPAPNCACLTGLFNHNTFAVCKECIYKCSGCSILESKCTSCSSDTRHQTPICDCKPGFFDDGLESEDCLTCIHPCSTCENNNLNCLSCVVGFKRFTQIPDCLCEDGYYDDGVNPDCVICNHPCVNCENDTQCKSCVVRVNSQQTHPCECLPGFYEDQNTLECLKCAEKCLTCSQFNVCIECKLGQGRSLDQDNNCPCSDGYFDTNKNELTCGVCSYRCQQCENNSNNCILCQDLQNRVQQPICKCKDTYYDDGLSIECLKCNFPCNKCTSETKCISCLEENRNPPYCGCKKGYIQQINQQNEQVCLKCNPKCKSCEQNLDNCSICVKGIGRNIQNAPQCECLPGYLELEGESDCQKCGSQCLECSKYFNTCTKCLNKNLLPPLCNVQNVGYFSLGSQLDIDLDNIQNLQCSPKCLKCTQNYDNCSQCAVGMNRMNSVPQCDCFEGFYDTNGLYVDCKKCYITCKTCAKYPQCESCDESENFEFDPYLQTCECKLNYKFNEKKSKCQKCYYLNGQCLLKCPKNTDVNEKTQFCEEKQGVITSYLQWFLVVGITIVAFQILGFFCVANKIKLRLKRYKHLQKLQQDDQQQNNLQQEEKV